MAKKLPWSRDSNIGLNISLILLLALQVCLSKSFTLKATIMPQSNCNKEGRTTKKVVDVALTEKAEQMMPTTSVVESSPDAAASTITMASPEKIRTIPTLKVLFRNKNVAVVVKPAGIPCHPLEFRGLQQGRGRGRTSKGGGPNRSGRYRGTGIPTTIDSDAPPYTVVDMARATFFRSSSKNDTSSNTSRISSQDHGDDNGNRSNGDTITRKEKTDDKNVNKIHLVHRLDAPTSGCLMIAFNADAARQASQLFNNHTTEKTYFALCRGDGESLRRRSHDSDGYFVVDGDVKDSKGIQRNAKTKIRCWMGSNGQAWENGRRCCLVEAVPFTGRFHQIRSHLGREHHPLVGETQHHKDIKENRAWKEILDRHDIPQRPCLHCHRLVVEDLEGTGLFDDNDEKGLDQSSSSCRILDVSCPLPDDFQRMIRLTDWSDQALKRLPQLFVPIR